MSAIGRPPAATCLVDRGLARPGRHRHAHAARWGAPGDRPRGSDPRPHHLEIGAYRRRGDGFDGSAPPRRDRPAPHRRRGPPEADLHLLNDSDLTFAAVRTDEKSLRTLLESPAPCPTRCRGRSRCDRVGHAAQGRAVHRRAPHLRARRARDRAQRRRRRAVPGDGARGRRPVDPPGRRPHPAGAARERRGRAGGGPRAPGSRPAHPGRLGHLGGALRAARRGRRRRQRPGLAGPRPAGRARPVRRRRGPGAPRA